MQWIQLGISVFYHSFVGDLCEQQKRFKSKFMIIV